MTVLISDVKLFGGQVTCLQLDNRPDQLMDFTTWADALSLPDLQVARGFNLVIADRLKIEYKDKQHIWYPEHTFYRRVHICDRFFLRQSRSYAGQEYPREFHDIWVVREGVEEKLDFNKPGTTHIALRRLEKPFPLYEISRDNISRDNNGGFVVLLIRY